MRTKPDFLNLEDRLPRSTFLPPFSVNGNGDRPSMVILLTWLDFRVGAAAIAMRFGN
jgi:hypothetical protein